MTPSSKRSPAPRSRSGRDADIAQGGRDLVPRVELRYTSGRVDGFAVLPPPTNVML